MTQWTDDDWHLDLDPKFKEDIRDCRAYLLSDKVILDTYKNFVLEQMKQTDLEEKILTNFGYKFHVFVKTLLHIGAGISKSHEFEDILEDLEEKLADICIKVGLHQKAADNFFRFLVQMFDPLLNTLSITRHRQRFSKTWAKFIEGVRLCVLHMHAVRHPMEGKSPSGSLKGSTPLGGSAK
jgi:hypothetical protein